VDLSWPTDSVVVDLSWPTDSVVVVESRDVTVIGDGGGFSERRDVSDNKTSTVVDAVSSDKSLVPYCKTTVSSDCIGGLQVPDATRTHTNKLFYLWLHVHNCCWRVLLTLLALDQRCLRRLLSIKWYQVVSNAEVWQRTSQSLLTLTIQSRHLSLFGHRAQTDDNNIDAKKILSVLPPEGWKKTARTSLYQMAQDCTEWREIPQHHIDWGIWYHSKPPILEAVGNVQCYTVYTL